MNSYTDIFDIFKVFDQYSDVAPKSLGDVQILETKCRAAGFDMVAEYLFTWRISMLYHIEREYTEEVEDASTA